MISMELSGVQRNTETSAEHNAAIERFLAQGGTIQVLEGFVPTPRPISKPYGRNHAQPVKADPSKSPPKRRTGDVGVRVSQTVKDRVKGLAVTMTLASVHKETGLSGYVLRRIAKEGDFVFLKWDQNTNLVPYQVDPIADALNVVRIKDARDRGLSQKAAVRELQISNTLMRRLIRDFAIDYPLQTSRR